MTEIIIAQGGPVLVAIDIAKARHEVLIAVPDKKRRRRHVWSLGAKGGAGYGPANLGRTGALSRGDRRPASLCAGNVGRVTDCNDRCGADDHRPERRRDLASRCPRGFAADHLSQRIQCRPALPRCRLRHSGDTQGHLQGRWPCTLQPFTRPSSRSIRTAKARNPSEHLPQGSRTCPDLT